MIYLKVLALLEKTCILGCQKIPLNSLLRPGTEGTEMKTFFLTSKPASGYLIGVAVFLSDSLIIHPGSCS